MKEFEQKRLDEFVARWEAAGRQTMLYGLHVSTFTPEQLFAVIGYLGDKLQAAQERTSIAWQKGFRSADMY